jgi:hypothetical protein
MDDIKKLEKGYSPITNTQIWKILGTEYSPNSVRDKVQKMIRLKYFKGRYEQFIGDKYYNRVLYVGTGRP